jgi:hypothetical protein
MRGALTAAGVAVAVGDLWLVVICWKSRSILAGFLAATGIPIVLWTVVGDPAQTHREAVLVITAIALVVAFALYGLGQSIQRLLDREPDDER